MGLDLNQNGTPLTYIQLVKNGTDWEAKTYYEVDELLTKNIHANMFGGVKDANSPKWTKVCGSCHVTLTKADAGHEQVRKYNLGMSADFVKNGAFINFTNDTAASGYDVHMSPVDASGNPTGIGCGGCHLRQGDYYDNRADLESIHNFLKGTDTAHNVRNDLDNNVRPKNCEQCHVDDIDGDGSETAVVAAAHEEKFGTTTGIHMEKISCQACHIPFKKTWRFRTFDDTLGYYGNFDNRMGYNVVNWDNDDKEWPVPTAYPLMAYPPEYAMSPVYGPSPGYGIPHFNMVAQSIEADGSGQIPMDYVSEMVDYFHILKSADTGKIVGGMPSNARFDFWKYFLQMNMQKKMARGVPLTFDPVWDNHNTTPLYYGNGTNGYPQIVTGNPITIMTWVDASAGDDNADNDNEMADISYGGAKILYLREIIAAVSEYYPPTELRDDCWNMDGSLTGACTNEIGRVVLKDSGYTIYDHTGDMYPELWSVADVQAMQAALQTVLEAEGRTNPMPMIFIAAHYFSDTHGVQRADVALGATAPDWVDNSPTDETAVGCIDCHGDLNDDAGAHRVTDRVLNFMPWNPPWFTDNDDNRLLRYNLNGDGAMDPTGSATPLFIVDGEVDYIARQSGNNLSFLGATAEEVLELSEHHAQHLFYQHFGEEASGNAIYGLNPATMTDEEINQAYVPQVNQERGFHGRAQDWIPADLREHTSAFGFAPVEQEIKVLHDGNIYPAEAKVFIYGLTDEVVGAERTKGVIVKMPLPVEAAVTGMEPWIVFQPAGAAFDAPWIRISDPDRPRKMRRAEIVRYGDDVHNPQNQFNHMILRAGPGRYAAVNIDFGGAIPAPTDPNDPDYYDCNGVQGGNALFDECGVCDNDPNNDNTTCLGCDNEPFGLQLDDCNVCGGNNKNKDHCGVCFGDNTTCWGCDGTWGSGAYVDRCGVCDDNDENDDTTCNPADPIDCAGVRYVAGTEPIHKLDHCGVCDDNDNNDCIQDCGGIWGGPHTEDACGVCDKDPLNDNDTCRDCAGVPNGTHGIDQCGMCIPQGDPGCGLMWVFQEGSPYPPKLTYAEAENYCATLEANSFDDFRLPDNDELLDLAGPPMTVMPIRSGDYWSTAVDVTAGTHAVISVPSFDQTQVDNDVAGSYGACVRP
jgi:hypothetical protein